MPKELRTATMASIPGREESREAAIKAITPQVDRLIVYVNEAPNKDLTDAGKFYRVPEEGYHFTVDDDLIYPPNYIDRLIEGIERYDREAVVTFHGRRLKKNPPVKRYYRAPCYYYPCLKDVEKDRRVHFGGTGVMGYHTSTIRLSLNDFPLKYPCMADIHMALACQKADVPIIVIAHHKGWLLHANIDLGTTIYRRSRDNDRLHVERINSYRGWKP